MKFLRMPPTGKRPIEAWVTMPRLNVTWGFPDAPTARAVAAPRSLFGVFRPHSMPFGIWRLSRRRALVETLSRLFWPKCNLARGAWAQTIHVQFNSAAFNLPILADEMGISEPELWVILARMDGFHINRLMPSGPLIEFNFPAHWAPSAFGDAEPYCPICRNTGTEDWSHLGINACDCSRAVWTLTGGDWPDAPHPFTPPATAQANSPTGRTEGTTAPAPDKSGPGQPSQGKRA